MAPVRPLDHWPVRWDRDAFQRFLVGDAGARRALHAETPLTIAGGACGFALACDRVSAKPQAATSYELGETQSIYRKKGSNDDHEEDADHHKVNGACRLGDTAQAIRLRASGIHGHGQRALRAASAIRSRSQPGRRWRPGTL